VLDRERADRLRAALRAAQESAAAEPPGAAGPSGYAEMPVAREELRDYIRTVVREDYFPLAKQCYESALATNPHLGGRISMSFAVVGDKKVGGVVESAGFDDEASTIIDPGFRTCLRESMLSVAFDAPPGGKVTVTYPIEFASDEPDAGH
jgi:hypothetical protein